MFSCNFCKKDFSFKGNMISHQKTAKYCLDIQGKNCNAFECSFCCKIFTTHQNLNDHLTSCKEKEKKHYEIKIQELEKQIILVKKECENTLEKQKHKYSNQLRDQDLYLTEKLKEMETNYTRQLEEKETTITKLEAKLEKFENAVIANTRNPITTNNTIVLNTLNLNDTEKFKSIIDEGLNKNVVCNGQRGLAKFVFDHILKGPDGKLMYNCVDPSRHIFECTNSDGIVEKDVRAIKLKRALIDSDVIVKAQKSGEELWTKEDGSMDTDRYTASAGKVMEIMTVDRDDTKFRSELSALTS